MPIRRLSSRTHRLDQSFLLQHLQTARAYRRIAGYFTSSLFEVAHECLASIPEVQIVCNVDIHPADLQIAKHRETPLISRWNDTAIAPEALLNRERYRRLNEFLAEPRHQIRIAPDSVCGFLHGKAGVITLLDGRKLGFIGSMNETRSGWQRHYEILWEDDSAEGVAWIEEEFAYLWHAACPLPQALIREVRRRSQRHEISVEQIHSPDDAAPAALIESPLYRQGFSLQPWQQGFVAECIAHRRNHGVVRLLLADEVGLGKTLSLGTAALALCLLNDRDNRRRRPVLILAPATLCQQWQTEMMDKLGIPCARWHTLGKYWCDEQGRAISPSGRERIARCPLRIGIVSTGLMLRDSEEKQQLLSLHYALLILDEAHKARSRQGIGPQAGSANRLLACMRELAARAEHVLLGTATPVQTHPADLWDLLGILQQGRGNFVLGNAFSPWQRPGEVLPIIAGEQRVNSAEHAWELLRSPLPPRDIARDPRARRLYSSLRMELAIPDERWQVNGGLMSLTEELREELSEELDHDIAGASFFQRDNPIVRHVVLRKRATLEAQQLLERIAVDLHPNPALSRHSEGFQALFEQRALRTSEDFRQAYAAARQFGKARANSGKGGGGFMTNLLAQRICSSIQAGINTATALLAGDTLREEWDEAELELSLEGGEEQQVLARLLQQLRAVDGDPKLAAILHYLEPEGWLELGVIIFSQYYDTARWVAQSLATRYPDEVIGLYAGAGRSRLYHQHDSVASERETLKRMVTERQIRLMIATDAACEGLNLQTLGTLINVDLPWNPTRLEQRIGRIKRFGQVRERVDMLNLVNAQTVDQTVYERLSERMQDRYNLFGALPDTLSDDWIEDIESLGEQLDQYIEAQQRANGFELRYNTTLNPETRDWRECAAVLSQQDVQQLMGVPWR